MPVDHSKISFDFNSCKSTRSRQHFRKIAILWHCKAKDQTTLMLSSSFSLSEISLNCPGHVSCSLCMLDTCDLQMTDSTQALCYSCLHLISEARVIGDAKMNVSQLDVILIPPFWRDGVYWGIRSSLSFHVDWPITCILIFISLIYSSLVCIL